MSTSTACGQALRVAQQRLGQLPVLVEHVVRGAHVARVQRRAQVGVHELHRQHQHLAVARRQRRLADVARVDRDDVRHLGHRRQRGAEHLADLAQPLPLQPGAPGRQIVERIGRQRDEVGIGCAAPRRSRTTRRSSAPLRPLVLDQQAAQRRRRVGRDHLVLLPERVHRDVGQVREAADRLRLARGGVGRRPTASLAATSRAPASRRRCAR